MGRVDGKACRGAIVLFQDDLDRDPQVRECGAKCFVVLLVAVDSGDEFLRIETAVVRRDEALNTAGIFVVPDLFDMGLENVLGHDMFCFQSARRPERGQLLFVS